MELNPYLTFNGQCEAAFKFYERCLGGKIVAMMTYGCSPMGHSGKNHDITLVWPRTDLVYVALRDRSNSG